MRQKALGVNNRRLAGVAQVLEANAAGTAADLWGDVPSTQATNEADPNPQFDSAGAGARLHSDPARQRHREPELHGLRRFFGQ